MPLIGNGGGWFMPDWLSIGLALLGSVAAAISAAAALFSARAAQRSAFYAESESRPEVVVYVNRCNTEATVECWELVIANIGGGMAYDIKFKAPRDCFVRGFVKSQGDDDGLMPIEDGPLVDGIPALAPGQKLRLWWGCGPAHWNRFHKRPFHIVAKYTDRNRIAALESANPVSIDWFDYELITLPIMKKTGASVSTCLSSQQIPASVSVD